MIAPTAGFLRRPNRKDMVSANMVLPLYSVLGEFAGSALRDRLFSEAGLKHLPGPEEPIREKQARDLHRAIRDACGDDASNIMENAGIQAADVVVDYRIPQAAQSMLRRLPWSVATLFLMRSTQQHSWTFTGSGEFRLLTTSQFEIFDNPLIRGNTTGHAECLFQAALFQHLFRRIVHGKMSCKEVHCCAEGHDTCRFELIAPA